MTNPLAPGSLEGRVALVTGSSRGIGADTVRYLADAGASVIVNYRSKAPRAEKVVAEITAAGGRAIAVGRRPHRCGIRCRRCSSAQSPSSAPSTSSC